MTTSSRDRTENDTSERQEGILTDIVLAASSFEPGAMSVWFFFNELLVVLVVSLHSLNISNLKQTAFKERIRSGVSIFSGVLCFVACIEISGSSKNSCKRRTAT